MPVMFENLKTGSGIVVYVILAIQEAEAGGS
jgi:hypothetical protein